MTMPEDYMSISNSTALQPGGKASQAFFALARFALYVDDPADWKDAMAPIRRMAREAMEAVVAEIEETEAGPVVRRNATTVDLKTAASALAKVLGDDRRVVCVVTRADLIAVMIDHTKHSRPEIPTTWQGWPVEVVDHGPMAVMGGDPDA